jgi:hypothetical protein
VWVGSWAGVFQGQPAIAYEAIRSLRADLGPPQSVVEATYEFRQSYAFADTMGRRLQPMAV